MYTVKKIWRTLQGEGAYAGHSAVFVRFVGCNLWSGHDEHRQTDAARSGASCPLWCDTDFTKDGARRYGTKNLVDTIRRTAGDIRMVVLTGGEPLLQMDTDLIRGLRLDNFRIHVETNGTIPWNRSIAPDWITCSPKTPVENVALRTINELKLVVPDYTPTTHGDLVIRVLPTSDPQGYFRKYLWLQPEDGIRTKEATAQAIQLSHDNPEWTVSIQTHKLIGVE